MERELISSCHVQPTQLPLAEYIMTRQMAAGLPAQASRSTFSWLLRMTIFLIRLEPFIP